MHVLQPYYTPIIGACLVFPFVACFVTVPFAVRSYRKYGGISLLRTMIVYSFILYMLCAFLLTVLPLPERSAVAKLPHITFNWVPFSNLAEGLKDRGDILILHPSTWTLRGFKKYLTSGDFFQIVANLFMLTPLGIYLRYYFRFDLKKTVLAGFLLSLFYELTQLSGLYFIYPQPYRVPDINDLMTNTAGAAIGYFVTPLFTFWLPTREQIDESFWRKGEKITLMRQIFAAIVDWMLIGAVAAIADTVMYYICKKEVYIDFAFRSDMLIIILFFCVLQWLMKGATPGKRLLRIGIESIDRNGKAPSVWRYLARYGMIYLLYPFILFMNMLAVGATIILLMYNEFGVLAYIGIAGTSVCIIGTFAFFARCAMKYHSLPHDHYSGMQVVLKNTEHRQ